MHKVLALLQAQGNPAASPVNEMMSRSVSANVGAREDACRVGLRRCTSIDNPAADVRFVEDKEALSDKLCSHVFALHRSRFIIRYQYTCGGGGGGGGASRGTRGEMNKAAILLTFTVNE